jgi:predicted butyrate kinase (DUF1464 family)
MARVAGTDPGTSSLDLLVLEDGAVIDQCRVGADELRADPSFPVRWLGERGPFDLVAGPSGYGLPLVRARDCTPRDLALMTLVRPDERGHDQGVLGFAGLVRAFQASPLPVVFLPGVIHLPTVPAYRKINRVDLGTADKLCVAALALDRHAARHQLDPDVCHLCVIELGTAFTACVVMAGGRIVDGLGGTSGPPGWRSGGAWDGEAAYLLSPLHKADLFTGGVESVAETAAGQALFQESLVKAVAGLQAVTPFEEVVLSGRLLEYQPAVFEGLVRRLGRLAKVTSLESLPGAWVKHAAQGAALLADGLAEGSRSGLVEQLALRQAAGTVLDWLSSPRAAEVRAAFR